MLRRNCSAAIAAIVSLLLPIAAIGSDPPESRDEAIPALDERVEVHLVPMSILALDRHGRPVTDLTADEIVVKDRGSRPRIADLTPARPPEREGPVPFVRLHVDAPGGWDESPAAPTGAEPVYLVVFVDAENDHRLEKSKAIDDAIRFVNEELSPEYRIAVFAYDGAIHQESPFTANREVIAHALRRAYDRPARPDVDLHARIRNLISRYQDCVVASSGFVREGDEGCIRDVTLEYADERRPPARDYLNALEAVVRFAAGLNGRRTVLALSHGVATNPATEAIEAARAVFGTTDQLARIQLAVGFSEGARQELDRLIDLAIRQRVTVHFVDRNLSPSSVVSARQGDGLQPGASPMLTAFEAPQWDLEELATHTGGLFVGSPGALFGGLKKAMAADAGGYFLSYYVDGYRTPQQLAKVKVDSTRRGVRIRHRRGHFNQPSVGTIAGSILLGAQRRAENASGEAQHVPFRIEANPAGLGYELAGGAAHANFTLHFLVRSENGRLLADSFHFISHAYPQELWEAGDVAPVTIDGWLEAPVGQYAVEAYFHNIRNGREGELTLDVALMEGAGEESSDVRTGER